MFWFQTESVREMATVSQTNQKNEHHGHGKGHSGSVRDREIEGQMPMHSNRNQPDPSRGVLIHCPSWEDNKKVLLPPVENK